MGRGMKAGKRPKTGGGGNMQKQMQQMQAVQRMMEEISQKEMGSLTAGLGIPGL